MTVTTLRAFAAASGVVALLAISGCTETPPAHETRASSSSDVGQQGAANLSEGFLSFGRGPTEVDIYFDVACPYCRKLELMHGDRLHADAAANRITLRLHPVAVLDRRAPGKDGSTRAAAMITRVAVEDPSRAQRFMRLLTAKAMDGIPSDLEMQSIVSESGASLSADHEQARYLRLVREWTERALSGPLTATEKVPSLSSVPLVVVNGDPYEGETLDAGAFNAFYEGKLAEAVPPSARDK